MQQESLGGKRYLLTFKDKFSGFGQIYFLQKKSEVFGKLKEFFEKLENQFDKSVRKIQ